MEATFLANVIGVDNTYDTPYTSISGLFWAEEVVVKTKDPFLNLFRFLFGNRCWETLFYSFLLQVLPICFSF